MVLFPGYDDTYSQEYEKNPEQKISQPILKVFSMFMIKMYYKGNDIKRIIGIKYINCKKIVVNELKNKKLSEIITVFVKVVVCSACWYIVDQRTKKPNKVQY